MLTEAERPSAHQPAKPRQRPTARVWRTSIMNNPRLSFWQISNMSLGFLGIQFGWGLQLANMSAIYSYLGAKESDIPLLWLAGPVTGLIVAPIIAAMSARTWKWLGWR